MIRFAVCDDEPVLREELSALLADYMGGAGHCRCFADGPSLLDSGGEYDVIFLDIRMGPPDGMETARQLRRRGCRSRLIFVTVLEELVFDAFDVDASGYLVKPLDPERFRRTMDRVLAGLEDGADLLIRQGTACLRVPLAEIVYCEVQGRKLYLHRTDGAVVSHYGRMEKLEERVDGRFFRCHRSYLVNLDHVRGTQDGQILLSQGERIPVSRLRERELAQALLRRMSGRCR